MPKLNRVLQRIFGSTAGANQIGRFGSLAAGTPQTTTDPAVMQSLSNWLGGWYSGVVAANSPAIEDMNALHYVLTYQIAYMMQEGIPEYDSTTEYYIGSMVQDGTGVIYVSLTGSGVTPNLGNALSNATHWQRGITNTSLANMADQRIKGNVSGVAGAPSDLTAQQVRDMIYSARTRQIFTSGSGTYTTPANCKMIRVRMVGGGSGGKGSSGNNTAGASAGGGNTTFSGGTVSLTAGGGVGAGVGIGGVGLGGSVTLTGPVLDLGSVAGSHGQMGLVYTQSTAIGIAGGNGGPSVFGGMAFGGNSQTNAVAGGSGASGNAYGAGGGGGGQGALNNSYSGGGGGSGGYVDVLIASPVASYSYAVGAGGGGSGGVGSLVGSGGAGAGGAIIVEEFYL